MVDHQHGMTLRPCAAPGCWRMFPVVLPSSRLFCDSDCADAAAAHALVFIAGRRGYTGTKAAAALRDARAPAPGAVRDDSTA